MGSSGASIRKYLEGGSDLPASCERVAFFQRLPIPDIHKGFKSKLDPQTSFAMYAEVLKTRPSVDLHPYCRCCFHTSFGMIALEYSEWNTILVSLALSFHTRVINLKPLVGA